jgi:hypothetical protein
MRGAWALLLACLPAVVWAAEAPVRVEFIEPAKFTDIRDSRSLRVNPERNQHLKSLRSWFEKQAPKRLAPGQRLVVEFTDIDLAGDYEPIVNPVLADVRIVKSIYPPRLAFRYRLEGADGQVLASGEEVLRDLGFDSRPVARETDPLRFEKRMLAEWLRETFDDTVR